MPFSADSKPEQVSREVQELLRRKSELESDQTKLISKVVSSFVNSLVPGRSSGVAVPSQLDKVIDGDYNDPLVWDTVARLGFYREFMRSVSGQNFVIVLRASRLTITVRIIVRQRRQGERVRTRTVLQGLARWCGPYRRVVHFGSSPRSCHL
jgi:hypothetical protein